MFNDFPEFERDLKTFLLNDERAGMVIFLGEDDDLIT